MGTVSWVNSVSLSLISSEPAAHYPTHTKGGTMTANDWNVSPDPHTTEAIVRRCYALEPSLAPIISASSPDDDAASTIPIIKVNVGLRPARIGGARVEREVLTLPLPARPFVPTLVVPPQGNRSRKVHVVHAYGLGPAGFQASWGVAEDVLTLVEECFPE